MSNNSYPLWMRVLAALWPAMAVVIGSSAQTAGAAPFAYVANSNPFTVQSSTVSVIDTASSPPEIVAAIPVGRVPAGVAVTPNGKQAYVTNEFDSPGTVSVIDTASNTVTSTITVGDFPIGVAISADGARAYVANGGFSGTISVIDTTASPPAVLATVPVGVGPFGIAVSADGTRAYVTNNGSDSVSVIDTTVSPPTVVATVEVGRQPKGVAVTPDGERVYVANSGSDTASVIDMTVSPPAVVGSPIPLGGQPWGVVVTPDGTKVYVANANSNNVSVIGTSTNTVTATVAAGGSPTGLAITPEGDNVYVANASSNTVSVIDTTASSVTTVSVGVFPEAVGIMPPPQCVPFRAFSGKLRIAFSKKRNTGSFDLEASLALGSASNGLNPRTQPVSIKVGTFSTTIPPGSFTRRGFGPFTFYGVINGVRLQVAIVPNGVFRYLFQAQAAQVSLTGNVNPVPVTLNIGDDCGAASINAQSN
jgi:YVTN family beta-propeller protein